MPSSPKRRGSRSPVAAAAETTAHPGPNVVQSSLNVSGGVPTMVISSTVAQNEFGRVFDRAMAGTDVAIAKHNVVRAVLVSADRYRELVRHQTVDLGALSSRFEQLYASMQRPEVRAATDRALGATPAEMGKAAVAAARRSRRQAPGTRKNR